MTQARAARGCEACRHTGYRGRLVLAELLPPLAGDLGQAVLQRRDAPELARLAAGRRHDDRLPAGPAAVESGQTDPAEVRRVLGFSS